MSYISWISLLNLGLRCLGWTHSPGHKLPFWMTWHRPGGCLSSGFIETMGFLELRVWGNWKPRTFHRASHKTFNCLTDISQECSPYKYKNLRFYSNIPLQLRGVNSSLIWGEWNLRGTRIIFLSKSWSLLTDLDSVIRIMILFELETSLIVPDAQLFLKIIQFIFRFGKPHATVNGKCWK